MAHHKSAKKRIRKSKTENLQNRVYLSKMKTEVKKVLNASAKDKAEDALKDTYSLLDKMVCKKIIPRNRAANKKSRLTKDVNNLT